MALPALPGCPYLTWLGRHLRSKLYTNRVTLRLNSPPTSAVGRVCFGALTNTTRAGHWTSCHEVNERKCPTQNKGKFNLLHAMRSFFNPIQTNKHGFNWDPQVVVYLLPPQHRIRGQVKQLGEPIILARRTTIKEEFLFFICRSPDHWSGEQG